MDIPDETPKKNQPESRKKGKEGSPTLPQDPQLEKVAKIVSQAAAGVVHSRAKLNMLSFLLTECEDAERLRSPEDDIKRTHRELNIVEKFLLDRSESPLQEITEAQQYLEMLDKPVTSIDESDPSKKTLKDVLQENSPEKLQQIQKVAEQLIKKDTIQEKIRDIVLQSSPELLEDYQNYQEVIGGLSQEQNLNIILGESATDSEKKDFRGILQEEEKENQGWSMFEAEKARILCHAFTLPNSSDKKPAVMAEAKNILGEDAVNLIQAQITHTNNTILKLYANDQEPSNTPEEVVAPEILERMGEAGPNKQQLKALADVQEFYLLRRNSEAPSPEEQTHQTARTALATLYTLNHGQWIENTNILKEYREVLQSKKKDFAPLLDERDKSKEEEPSPKETSNPIPGKPTAYQKRMEGIAQIVDTFNEGATDGKTADKDKILAQLEKASEKTIAGLYKLEEEDIQKVVKPQMLATAISAYLGKEKQKADPQNKKKKIAQHMQHHISKIQQKMFAKCYTETKEAILPQENRIFGNNAAIVEQLKQSGNMAMDQIS